MSPDTPAGPRWAASAVRLAFAAAGLALAFGTLSGHRALRAARADAFRWLERTGVTLDAATLGREPDPERVRLRAARAVLAAELDASRHQGLPPEREARESARRMEEAARVGREILARRPACWEAALVQGAATYVGWAQGKDPRLFTAYRQWEAPLETALRLAPAKREPARFLAAAYLEVWPALSPRKRRIARGLLAEVMRDPEDLSRLLDPWLDTAAGRREAFSVLPDDPAAWGRVAAAYARRGDLQGFAAARARQEEALLGSLRRDLLEADRLRGDGRIDEARGLYLSVAVRARPEARYQELIERALERCPPGPVDRQTAERLEPHFARALDRCLIAGCEIEPAALKRLSRFVREPAPPQSALAALFAGDLPRAELYERRSEGMGTERWAPYLIAKARVLAARGRTEEAKEALSLVHLTWQRRPLYWRARAEVAQAAGDARTAGEARARLAAAARRAWPATEWTWRKGTARLEMVTGEPAAGVAVALDSVSANGALLELRLDGAALGAFPVRPLAGAAPALRAPVALGRGLHVLEIESLDGQFLPGPVEIIELR
jgi:hypothetical protein